MYVKCTYCADTELSYQKIIKYKLDVISRWCINKDFKICWTRVEVSIVRTNVC